MEQTGKEKPDGKAGGDGMNDIQVIKYNDIRVVTTKQISEAYGTDSKSVSKAFNNNKERYTEGKHYFLLTGDLLKANRKIYDLPKNCNRLYLWTERGALLLAKSINTDIAWEAYERLVDFYFEKKEGMENFPQVRNYSIPTQSTTHVPLVSDWYSRNKSRIWEICNSRNIKPKTLYHHILVHIGQKYDIGAANLIYEQEKGYPPMNAIDIVGYFSELEEMADEYMDKLL